MVVLIMTGGSTMAQAAGWTEQVDYPAGPALTMSRSGEAIHGAGGTRGTRSLNPRAQRQSLSVVNRSTCANVAVTRLARAVTTCGKTLENVEKVARAPH